MNALVYNPVLHIYDIYIESLYRKISFSLFGMFYICTSKCATYYAKLLQERHELWRGFFQFDRDSERVKIFISIVLKCHSFKMYSFKMPITKPY